jgi:hypothetical protein
MGSTWQLLENYLGFSQRELNDPNLAAKIKREAAKKLPPQFCYLSGYRKLNKWQESYVRDEQQHKLAGVSFSYKMAKAQDEQYDEAEDRRIKRNFMVLEATDRETGVKFQYELDQDPNIHVLFIGNKNPRKPAGYYKVKKTMERFRDMILEENKKEYAWGRSLASTYPVKLNRKRWADTNGDWRRQPACIKNKFGQSSKHIDRLAGFYLRTGLWIPVDWNNYESEGIKIIMPSYKILDEMITADKDYVAELQKFSKDEYNKHNK